MAKCTPYHTTSDEYPPNRNVYHNHDDCPDGKRIKPENKIWTDGGRPRCDECKKLD